MRRVWRQSGKNVGPRAARLAVLAHAGETISHRARTTDLESPSQAVLRKIFSYNEKKSYGFQAPVRIFSPTLGICTDVCSDAPIPTAGRGHHQVPERRACQLRAVLNCIDAIAGRQRGRFSFIG